MGFRHLTEHTAQDFRDVIICHRSKIRLFIRERRYESFESLMDEAAPVGSLLLVFLTRRNLQPEFKEIAVGAFIEGFKPRGRSDEVPSVKLGRLLTGQFARDIAVKAGSADSIKNTRILLLCGKIRVGFGSPLINSAPVDAGSDGGGKLAEPCALGTAAHGVNKPVGELAGGEDTAHALEQGRYRAGISAAVIAVG